MKCNHTQNKIFCLTILVVGLITAVFGIVWTKNLPGEAHNLNMLAGMFAGLGSALAFLGAMWLVRLRIVSPEKLKLERIEQNDERNVQIRRIAYTVASNAATLLFAALAFVLLWLNYQIPAILSIGAMYLHFIVFLIASRVAARRV